MKTLPLKINTFHPIIKPEWKKFDKYNTTKVFSDIPVENDILKNLFLAVRKCNDGGFNNFVVEIKNNLNKIFATDVFSVSYVNKSLLGENMMVNMEYRRKNYRFGELMRLASIMEMIENKLNSIKIYSKNSAIYFHSKYKFKPAIQSVEEADNVLKVITNDSSQNFCDLSLNAQKMLKESSQKKNKNVNDFCGRTNKLLTRYLERALKEGNNGKGHPISENIAMILDMKTIKENKDFFNELYKKHGIDYKI